MLSLAEVVLNAVGLYDPEDLNFNFPSESPNRPIVFHFDFIEVFAGASLLTDFLSFWVFSCGPPLEISASAEFDVLKV